MQMLCFILKYQLMIGEMDSRFCETLFFAESILNFFVQKFRYEN